VGGLPGPRKFSNSVDHRWRADAEPDLLRADEPTSSLGPKTLVEITELISRRDTSDLPAGCEQYVAGRD
jgi:hypothetical protein